MSVPDDLLARLEDLLDLDPGTLSPETPLDAVEGWDSVNQMRVLVQLEKESGVPLDFDHFMSASTVADLISVGRRGTTPVGSAAGAELR